MQIPEIAVGKVTRYIRHASACKASCVVVRIRAPIVSGRAVRVAEPGGKPASNECLQTLVNRGQRNAGYVAPNVQEDLVRGGMTGGVRQETVDGRALFGKAVAVGLESCTED